MPEDSAWKKYAARFKVYPSRVSEDADPSVSMIFCIPVFAEPHILLTLASLLHAQHHQIKAEAILLFNITVTASDDEKRMHKQSYYQTLEWISHHQDAWIRFIPIYIEDLPDPKGGVGWARKLCMDEGARRLGDDGILVCLDADCRVSKNYVTEIKRQFDLHRNKDAASIYFEHDLNSLEADYKSAITEYELHLRYLIHAQRWCGHPFAYYTVGSTMAVRRSAYLSQGGINTRRAGEDFYFLQKFIETGKIFEIKQATVFPEARISTKVPFGTGRAMGQIIEGKQTWLTTDFKTFEAIRPLFASLPAWWKETMEMKVDLASFTTWGVSDLGVLAFLREINFLKEIALIHKHTASFETFKMRFFRFFNAFSMIRYMHYMRDHSNPDVMVKKAILDLYDAMGQKVPTMDNATELLLDMRQRDRN